MNNNNELTKQQAHEAMKNGSKVSHYNFGSDEYIHILNGKMLTEDGYRFEQGWEDRKEDYWQNGWRVYHES